MQLLWSFSNKLSRYQMLKLGQGWQVGTAEHAA